MIPFPLPGGRRETETPAARTLRVLVVDDREESRNALATLLLRRGHQVTQAANGSEALQRLNEDPYDLVASDVLMPVMDGYALCREVKADRRFDGVFFLVCTATHTDERDEALALGLGADRFVRRPIDPNELVRTIEETAAGPRRTPTRAARGLAEPDVFRLYSERLVLSLEQKLLHLEVEEKGSRRQELVRDAVQSAVAHAVDAIGILDHRGRLLYANHSLAALVDGEADELTGRPLSRLLALEDRSVRRNLTASLRRGEAWQGRHELESGDTNRTVVAVTISPIREAGGGTGAERRYVAILRDVTHEAHRDERLRHAQMMDGIGRLAGGIAHDFNNHLTVILGYTELVLSRLDEEDETLSFIEEIKGAAERAEELTRRLLAFSRRRGEGREVVDLADVVRELLPMLERLTGESTTIRLSLASEPQRVTMDRSEIEQIVANLLLNASDAMAEGGDIDLRTRVSVLGVSDREPSNLQPGRYVVLEVGDHGTGMSEEMQRQVFEPFFTTKPEGHGTGLGLSIVYRIVHDCGGTLAVRSRPGDGTTIEVYLPFTEAPVTAEPAAADVEPQTDTRLATVLLVEDEPSVRRLVRHTLVENGYRVLAAEDGEGALAVVDADKEDIEILLTDVVMPRMSGHELSERVRQTLPEVKVLFMSGYPRRSTSDRPLLPPGAPLLRKPFTSHELLKALQHLDQRASR